MKTNASILSMYAVTPCHAGSGSSTGVVDLPIQRERHTNWPVIQASGMKGAMRAHFERYKESIQERPEVDQFKNITDLVFGSEKQEHAGSLSVGDVKILAYPMRSNISPFVWITCPAVLTRLNRDLMLAGKEPLNFEAAQNLTPDNSLWISGLFKVGQRILLEDMEVVATAQLEIVCADTYFQGIDRLLIVQDEVFGYGVTHCTSVMAQIKIDQATGTTAKSSLRYQEELPADTLMYCTIFWGDSRDVKESLKAAAIRQYVEKDVIGDHLQVGGGETLGRGIFSLNWL